MLLEKLALPGMGLQLLRNSGTDVGVTLTTEHPQKPHLESWVEKKVVHKWG